MKIICTNNIAQDLEVQKITTHFINDYRCRLTIGREYLVMGMILYKKSSCLFYLIDHNGWPDWYPHMLFDVVDNSLPENWYIKLFNTNENKYLNILVGFDELCNKNKFYDELVEREEEASQIYFNRKEELQKSFD